MSTINASLANPSTIVAPAAQLKLDFGELQMDKKNSIMFPVAHLEEVTNTPLAFRGKHDHLRGYARTVDSTRMANHELGRSIIGQAIMHGWIAGDYTDLLNSVYFNEGKINTDNLNIYSLSRNDRGYAYIIMPSCGIDARKSLVAAGMNGVYPMHHVKTFGLYSAERTASIKSHLGNECFQPLSGNETIFIKNSVRLNDICFMT